MEHYFRQVIRYEKLDDICHLHLFKYWKIVYTEGVESFLYLKYYIIDLYVRTMVKRKIIVLYQS